MIINACLFVKNIYPHPAAGKDFPCYGQEKKLHLISGDFYTKYMSTIIAIQGSKFDSFEIDHSVAAVETQTTDEYLRNVHQCIIMLHQRMLEILKSKGANPGTKLDIHFKFYKETYKVSEIRQAIHQMVAGSRKLKNIKNDEGRL